MKLPVVHTGGKQTELEVSKEVFGATPNADLLSRAIYMFLSSQRQGTSKVKTRSDINRTKKKWYKQKGTGNARHGARTPNIFVGGGVSHGPTGNRNWTRELTKQQKKKAMVYALSTKYPDMMIAPELESLDGKTKKADIFVRSFVPEADRVLDILHESITPVLRAMQNIQRVLVTQASRLNIYELLLADKVLMTEQAVRVLEKRVTGDREKENPGIKKTVVEKAVKSAVKTVAKKPTVAAKAAVKKTVKTPAKKSVKKVVKKAK